MVIFETWEFISSELAIKLFCCWKRVAGFHSYLFIEERNPRQSFRSGISMLLSQEIHLSYPALQYESTDMKVHSHLLAASFHSPEVSQIAPASRG